MFSILKPSLLYTDISTDIAEHDEDHDASEWSYSDRMVYRGSLDASYKSDGLDVYWLYDDNLTRVGLAEHESEDHSNFRTLWFRDTPFGTLLQEDWKAGDSLFSMMSSYAYQDATDSDVKLLASDRLVLPKYVMFGLPSIYVCSCGKSFSPKCSSVKKTVEITSPIFVDESFIMYQPPANSTVWSRLGLQPPDGGPLEQEPLQALPPEPPQEPQQEPPEQEHPHQPQEHHQELPQTH